ncbi:MAG: hypothetical protein P8J01_03080 [Acidimicrobiales bacterium]|jgi:hypothetical protein|nr:hypothetical protein [Acidimicrobiales bacterium]|tara:strand:- start:54 stop:575 length:522 start_codon:yes stop_codon:yes gene_type:complete
MATGLFFVVCEVLIISGITKVLSPSPTSAALSDVGLPSSIFYVRCLGSVEVVLGIFGILFGGRYFPLFVGSLFAFFSIFMVIALRNGHMASCGCFGSSNTPPSIIHLLANLGFMVISLVAIGTSGLSDTLAKQPGFGVPFLISILLGALLIFLCLAFGPIAWEKKKSLSRNSR